MTFKERLKGVAIGLVICVICIPVAVVITLFSSPFWSWFERTFGMESYGHSGPAEWCHLVSYGIVLGVCTLIWSRLERGKRDN